jgi:hypothetical protein
MDTPFNKLDCLVSVKKMFALLEQSSLQSIHFH